MNLSLHFKIHPLWYNCCILRIMAYSPLVFLLHFYIQYSHSDTLTSLDLVLSHVSHTDFYSLPSGQCYLLPSCPWHTGYRGLRRALQLLGQRRPHQVEDLRAARPAHHGLLLQQQRQHLCICFQLRLVEGRRRNICTCISLQ